MLSLLFLVALVYSAGSRNNAPNGVQISLFNTLYPPMFYPEASKMFEIDMTNQSSAATRVHAEIERIHPALTMHHERCDIFTAAASVAAVRKVKQPYTSHTHEDEYALNYCATIEGCNLTKEV